MLRFLKPRVRFETGVWGSSGVKGSEISVSRSKPSIILQLERNPRRERGTSLASAGETFSDMMLCLRGRQERIKQTLTGRQMQLLQHPKQSSLQDVYTPRLWNPSHLAPNPHRTDQSGKSIEFWELKPAALAWRPITNVTLVACQPPKLGGKEALAPCPTVF